VLSNIGWFEYFDGFDTNYPILSNNLKVMRYREINMIRTWVAIPMGEHGWVGNESIFKNL
jgi:hypothetical protein